MIHNRSMGEAPFSLARFPDMKIILDLNEEQLENFEMILQEAKAMLPDDDEEFQEAHEDSYAGTIREITEQAAKQTTVFSVLPIKA
tara:strand:- start:807 stop:1064 length:258 start_codon:yes stop_codon:yes gene_type:complete